MGQIEDYVENEDIDSDDLESISSSDDEDESSDEDEDLVPLPDSVEKKQSKLVPKEIEKIAGQRKKKKNKNK